jgi:hypothetical protein
LEEKREGGDGRKEEIGEGGDGRDPTLKNTGVLMPAA